VLEVLGAEGWLAEGVTRAYLVEGLASKFGGQFDNLDVGPSTATGVHIRAKYRLPSSTDEVVDISGSVPLRLRPSPGRR
jgi:hypothetical protein